MNISKKRVLVIAAHPDDEILGCGATMAKHSSCGNEVRVLILGQGVHARQGTKNPPKELARLAKQSKVAANIIGVSELHSIDFPDNAFDSVPLLEIVHAIEEIASAYKPHIIYTHHHGDVNVDHRQVSAAAQAAFRPLPGSGVEAVYAFEVASSTEWNFRSGTSFHPNVFERLDKKHLEKKIKAMESYVSEIRNFPHPRSGEYLRALAALRGGQSGNPLAEAFELVYLKR